jgi:hypothetical protein
MSKKYHTQKREFLNLKTDMRAYLIAMVEDTSDFAHCCGEHKKSAEVVFKIASCYDEIELHFDMDTASQRENSLYKANKLAEVIHAFRDAMEKEVALVNERETVHQNARAASAVH